ncbi:MAG: YdcF family protein [Chloroflexota bacterium]
MNVILTLVLIPIVYYSATLLLGNLLRWETPFDKPVDVAIVMGSQPFKAVPRLHKAVNLYHQGLVKKLLMTGKPSLGDSNEAKWLQQQAIKLGVNATDILLEEEATNCKENILYSRPIIESNQFESVVVILQEFSQLRAHLTAKKQLAGLNVKIFSQPASALPYWNRWTWMFTRIGWQYTWKTVSRLIRYRLKGDL